MKTKKTLPEGISEAMIDKWKKEFGAIFIYRTEDGKFCILKKPSLLILDATRAISKGSSIQFDIALVDNCWLHGDECLKTNDDYRLGLFDWLGGIIKKVEGELEEL
jgi:hypothetical protein